MDVKVKKIRGTRDILPEEASLWSEVEGKIREVCRVYGFGEIRVPTFEETSLFIKTTGETTDIVEKQMYTFEDKGGRSLTLKPEGTPSVVRAYLENALFQRGKKTKLFYIERMFRQERPQKGRYREFTQFGVELIGSKSPLSDAEIISLAFTLFEKIGVKDITLRINSIGCFRCRGPFRDALKEYLKSKLPELCPDCKRRFERNPLRVLDCKEDKEKLKDAPRSTDYLCEDCKKHWERLISVLEKLKIPFLVDHMLVRGLDYYTGPVFEFVSGKLGAQDAVGGGGRYDELIESMGGEPTPATGFAIGLDRLVMLVEKKKEERIPLWIVNIGEEAEEAGFLLMEKLRRMGVRVEMDLTGRSLKAQFREADKRNAKYVLVIGEDEIRKNKGKLKDMETGKEEEIELDEEKIKERVC
ncbi:histidine--tRNA ligase [Candidatus Bathyarchaeota archaeon]|nr:MAG: histidine--tRNA ligase [Candidatus Bathyarchaeota archaeon]